MATSLSAAVDKLLEREAGEMAMSDRTSKTDIQVVREAAERIRRDGAMREGGSPQWRQDLLTLVNYALFGLPVETSRDDAIDAAKWRALRNCARITAMGCAGLTQPHNVADDYAHLTLNFWTGVPDGDPGPGYAREWLDKFVAKALRAMPQLEPTPKPSRDAEHCDYPDCEQHWTHVVAKARALLEPLADCDPAIRQWLKTADLPSLQSGPPLYRHDWETLPGQSYRCRRCKTTCLDAHDALLCAVRPEKATVPHVHVWSEDTNMEDWAICNCGEVAEEWYCPTSPDHICHYNKGNYDSCDHCGKPEERK